MNYFDVLFAKKQSGGGGTPTLITKTITENGTYNASEDNADGYSQVTVNVPYMEKKSASGNIASFSDGTGDPFLKVKANINPVQDLHGYDYPWVGGAGKNKCSKNAGTITVGDFVVFDTPLPSGTYSVSFKASRTPNSDSYMSLVVYDKDGTSYSDIVGVAPSLIDGVTTIKKENATYSNGISKIYAYSIAGNWGDSRNYTLSISDFQLEVGSSATSFEPYSNICPISGFTGVNVAVTGVNIWDEQWETSGSGIKSKNVIRVFPNTTYYFKSPCNVTAYRYDANMNVISGVTLTQNSVFTTLSNQYYLWFDAGYTYGSTTYNNDISINYPSTDTSYHAYNGHVYPISWQDEAGIVYGGYIDLVSGVLTVTKVKLTEESWTKSVSNYGTFFCEPSLTPKFISNFQFDYLSDSLTPVSVNGASSSGDDYIYVNNQNRIVVKNTSNSAMTPAEFAEFMSDKEFVYELATPQTYNLTPQQINTLIGQNNVWNGVNGQTEVEYFIPIE